MNLLTVMQFQLMPMAEDLVVLEKMLNFVPLQFRKEVIPMKMLNRKKAQKEKVLFAVSKMIADKNAWLTCVQQGKSLSSLKGQDVVLSKLR